MSDSDKLYTILFVDDEPRITSALKALFRREYKVLTANSGQQALQVLEQETVDVLVSDQRMPEMSGSE
jgi:serine/threonine-protein kinase